MTIHPINPACAALLCTPADLSPYGLVPAALSPDQALLLVREACRSQGLLLPPITALELYPDSHGVLIFIYLAPSPASRPRPVRPLRRGRVRRRPT